jgi:hypothetical protein
MIFYIKKIVRYYTEGMPERKNSPPGLPGLLIYLKSIFNTMPPGLERLMKLQPITTLSTSILCIFLLRRGFEYVPLTIVLVIYAFFFITFKLYLVKNTNIKLTALWDAALVFVLHNMLLFVLPFYFESMTFPSRNMFFAPVIIGLTAIVGWYKLYQNLIAKHPLWSSLFYAFTFFCVLNFLLPILFGMRNIWSLLTSGGIAAVAVLLFVFPHIDLLRNRRNTLIFVLGICLTFSLLWFGRSVIPPSPLKLTGTAACREIIDFRPKDTFQSIERGSIEEVYFYSSIFAPRGLSEGIEHVWYHNGRKLFTISLSEIRGGRKEGFGTWSRHMIMEGPGRYSVDVWTAGGQLLGSGSFVLE